LHCINARVRCVRPALGGLAEIFRSGERVAKSCRVHHSVLGRVTVLELTRSGAAHAHSHPHLLLKLGGADGCFEVGGEPCALTDAQAILVNSWEPHAYRHADGARSTFVLAVYLDPCMGVASGAAGGMVRFASSCMPITRAVRSPAEAIVRELDRFSRCDARAVEEGLRALLDAAPTEWTGPPAGTGRPASAPGGARLDRRVARCMEYMSEHLAVREDLGEVGARFGLSRPHLFHLFRQSTRLTPAMYWNTLRMEFAVTRLARRDASVGRLAQDLGFSDPGNFTRFFHAIQGVAPSDYHAAALGTSRPAAL
jgi:AraC-like DNA-binding protein